MEQYHKEYHSLFHFINPPATNAIYQLKLGQLIIDPDKSFIYSIYSFNDLAFYCIEMAV